MRKQTVVMAGNGFTMTIKTRWPGPTIVATGAIIILSACDGGGASFSKNTPSPPARTCTIPSERVIAIEAGRFMMGQDDIYREEGLVREVSVDGFWIDATEVTNKQFSQFVDDTGYITVAEKPVDPSAYGVPVEKIPADLLLPGAAIFSPPERPSTNFNDWWIYKPGAYWRKPTGPEGKDADPSRPVVNLAFEDMTAYARWRGGRIPTEAEWEYAARANSENYTEQPSEANSWQGFFPVKDLAEDGFAGIAPVGCYKPNDWGLYDMVGNVWEVTSDFYAPGHDPNRPTHNPRGPSENAAYDPYNPDFPSRTIKGGSYLCAPNYCQRYRPTSRQGRDPGLGTSNVGFRLVYDSENAAKGR